MSEKEELLRQFGDELSEALNSKWQPLCIAAAFRTAPPGTLHLTLQGWIDLDFVRSPLLLGDIPEDLPGLQIALDAFGIMELDPFALTSEESLALAKQCREAVQRAFSTCLSMKPVEADSNCTPNGMGDWLPLYACLVTQCGVSPKDALELRVDRAYALIAGMRRNEGWQNAGTPYALRGTIGDKLEGVAHE